MMPPNLLGGSSSSSSTMDNKKGGGGGDQASAKPPSSSTEINGFIPQRPPPPPVGANLNSQNHHHLPNYAIAQQQLPHHPAAAAAAFHQAALYCQLMSQQSQVPVYDYNAAAASVRPLPPHFMPPLPPPPPFALPQTLSTFPPALPPLPPSLPPPPPPSQSFAQLFQNHFSALNNFAALNNSQQHSLRQYYSPQLPYNSGAAIDSYGRPSSSLPPPPRRNNNFNNLIQLVDSDEGAKTSPARENGTTTANPSTQQWSLSAISSTSTSTSTSATNKSSEVSSYRSSSSNSSSRNYPSSDRYLRDRDGDDYRSRRFDRSDRNDSRRRSSRGRSRSRSRSRSLSRSRSRSRSRSPPGRRSRYQDRQQKGTSYQRSSSARSGGDHHHRDRSTSAHHHRRTSSEREKTSRSSRPDDQPQSVENSIGGSSSRSKLKSSLEELLTSPGTYTRCFPLEPYYRQASVVVDEKKDGGASVVSSSVVAQGTDRLVALREAFTREVLDRAAAVRASKPAFTYPKRRVKLRRSNKLHDKCNGCDSETESDSETERLKDGGFAFNELQKKKTHPWRLHEELWHNDKGEMNDGPVCRCSLKARRSGIRHGIYLGEEPLPRCHPNTNNRHRLHHYLLQIRPLTNFVTTSPTVIDFDGHSYFFEGYSLLSHSPIIDTVPPCKVIRFNIEYTVAFVETAAEDFPANFTIGDLDAFTRYLFDELLELADFDMKAAGDEEGCTRFHFLPRFTRLLADGGKELLSMAAVLDYLRKSSRPLIEDAALDDIEAMSDTQWNELTRKHKGSLLTCPGVKPSTLRVDQIDRERGDLGVGGGGVDKSSKAATSTSNSSTSPSSPSLGSSDSNSNSSSSSDKNEEDEAQVENAQAQENAEDQKEETTSSVDHRYPVLVHFGIRPPQLSYAGNPKYQRAWRDYVKYRHLLANKDRVSFSDKMLLSAKEQKLAEFRTKSDLKRDVTVVVSSRGFLTTGLQTDLVQHSLLMPVLVCHLRFHYSLQHLEQIVGYRFKERATLQLALTHPSYRENYGTNPDHARNTLTNCGLRALEYGDRRVHFANTRKRGINMLIAIMSRFGCPEETASHINHNERLEFLGDAVVEFLTSIHLYYLFPELEEGGLATYRAAIVQNQHLALLARKLQLERFMLYAHGSDLCHDLELRHAMANCFEAFMGALFLDGGIEVADGVFSRTLFLPSSSSSANSAANPSLHHHPPHQQHSTESSSCCGGGGGGGGGEDRNPSPCKKEKEEDAEVGRTLYSIWTTLPAHPLQQQYPEGDRQLIASIPRLQELARFEEVIGVQFRHIRLLARAFTHRSVGFNNLTLGSNQRMEFLGDTVLQLVTSEFLYKFFPDHHEGHLSLLRSSLVNNKTQSLVCDDLGITPVTHYNCVKLELKTKDRADLLEAFIGALYVDQGIEHCRRFCEVCFFPRLEEFISNQGWNDPKSKLQQCCLTLRSANGGEPDIPVYKVIESKGPTNTRIYVVAVYFRDRRLAVGKGHSIQEAEMNAATNALNSSKELFPHLVQQKKVLERRSGNNGGNSNNGSSIVNNNNSSSISSRELGE